MDSFIINTTRQQKDIEKYYLANFNKQPIYIILFIIGILHIFVGIFKFFGITLFYISGDIFTNIGTGIIFLFFLFYVRYKIIQSAKKIYTSNIKLQHEIEYEFSDDGLKTKGYNFEASYKWNELNKIKIIKDVAVIYTSNLQGLIFLKEDFTDEQLNFVIYKLKKK